MWLVVGLGNPGREYQDNRHNIGFMVVDELARRCAAPAFRAKFRAELTQTVLPRDGQPAILCKPQQFMNLSGQAVASAAGFYKVAPAQIVVIHDELDLELGRLQVKAGGGHGGHNGLRSITQVLGSPEFVRVRCGIGRPRSTERDAVANYVLANFAKADRAVVEALIAEAADATEVVLKSGLTPAMNRFNVKKTLQT